MGKQKRKRASSFLPSFLPSFRDCFASVLAVKGALRRAKKRRALDRSGPLRTRSTLVTTLEVSPFREVVRDYGRNEGN